MEKKQPNDFLNEHLGLLKSTISYTTLLAIIGAMTEYSKQETERLQAENKAMRAALNNHLETVQADINIMREHSKDPEHDDPLIQAEIYAKSLQTLLNQ